MTDPGTFHALAETPLAKDHSDCVACWYCEMPLSMARGGHEHDHVVPRRHGGPVVVPACLNCHNLKDRTDLRDWEATFVIRFILNVPAGPQRILWAKLVGLACDSEARKVAA